MFNGSPADGSLQRGDVMLSINNSDVSAVYLMKAEELIKASSNMLQIVVRRYVYWSQRFNHTSGNANELGISLNCSSMPSS